MVEARVRYVDVPPDVPCPVCQGRHWVAEVERFGNVLRTTVWTCGECDAPTVEGNET